MQIIKTHAASPANKKASSPQEKRFEGAWQRVVDQQEQNDRLHADVQAFARETQTRIEDAEHAFMDAMYSASLHLLSFFSRKSLTQWQRRTLIDWVSQYLEIMEDSPFGSHLDLGHIRRLLTEALASAYPNLPDLPGHQEEDSSFAEFGFSPFDEEGAEDPLIDELFQKLFTKFEQANAAGGAGRNRHQANAQGAFFRQNRAQEQRVYEQQQKEIQAVKQLMKSSSMNDLFRKVAGVLHPDKEPDETARQEKNRLMTELIQARDTHDIPRLLAFYTEYVGQSPLEELGGSLTSVIRLLERQYYRLCAEKERFLIEDPLANTLYRRFHKKTPEATKRAINRHLKETHEQTNALLALPQEITSLNKLKPYLEVHYDMLFEAELLT